MKMFRNRKGGGSAELLTLLIVIVIICILAAALLPVFARAREKARQTVCLNNVKQLTLAIQMYAADYDECAPGVSHPWMSDWAWGGTRDAGYEQWQVAIDPYVKARLMFNCPSAAAPDQVTANAGSPSGFADAISNIPFPADWNGVNISYAINSLIQLSPMANYYSDSSWNWSLLDPNDPNSGMDPNCGYGRAAAGTISPASGWGGGNLRILKVPARVILIGDGSNVEELCYDKTNNSDLCGWQVDPNCDPNLGTFASAPDDAARHSAGNNWSFCDGHSKWYRKGIYTCKGDSSDPTSLEYLHGKDQLNIP